MENKDTIDLLNSEGSILTATRIPVTEHTGNSMKTIDMFRIRDQSGKSVAIMTKKEIFDFTRGNTEIIDSKDRVWNYGSKPGSMKPDLKTLDEFIGVDTTGKTY